VNLLFVTYAIVGENTLIGVFKRCLRLISALKREKYNIYILHFGKIPRDLFIDSIIVIPGIQLILGVNYSLKTIAEIYDYIKPDVVILGESPESGSISAASRAAKIKGIKQVCIENDYGKYNRIVVKTFYKVDKYFLLVFIAIRNLA
jgi:hypothetical protein